VRGIHQPLLLVSGASADREHERLPLARDDDRVVDAGRAVEESQRLSGRALNDECAFAGEDEEVLLRVLAVVHRHRLAGLEDVEVDAELRETLAPRSPWTCRAFRRASLHPLR
jgi:hypothetical protein